MATVARKVCDSCRSEENVDECIVSYHFEEGKPWAVDLCERCFLKRLGDLVGKSHSVKRSNLRPQYRMVETKITEKQLGIR